MDEKIIDVPIEQFVPEPANERKLIDEEDRKLAQSMVLHGQIHPIIAFELAAADKGVRKLQLIDGHRRWHGCVLNGSPKTLKTQLLSHEPTPAERAKIRALTDRHKQKLRPFERMLNICNAVKLNGWAPTEAARELSEDQATVSKNLLVDERATDPLRKRFEEDAISLDDAYIASQLPPEEQNALAAVPQLPSREQLKAMVKRKGKPAVKVAAVTVPIPGGYTWTIKGPPFDMPCLVQMAGEVKTQLSRAMAKGHDLKSIRGYFKKFPPAEQKGQGKS